MIAIYLLMGWGLTRLWRFVLKRTWDARDVAFSLIVISETLIWVRNSSALFVRALTWGFLLCYILPALIRGRTRTRSRTEIPVEAAVRAAPHRTVRG